MLQHDQVSRNVLSDHRTYPCTKCDAEFATEDQMESHVFVHFLALTTEYGCSSCLKLFNKPDELQKHLMDIHAHHLYRCSLCKEIFDSKVNVQVHFAVKHSNECKLYKCTTCGTVFRSEMEWQLHVKVNHLGVSKPYRCLFCKESFVTEVDLQCHLTTHEKQFPCSQCDEAFHVEYLLDKHVETCHMNGTKNTPDKEHLNKTIKREPDHVHHSPLGYSLSPPLGRFHPGTSPSRNSRQTSPQKSPKSSINSNSPTGNNIQREIRASKDIKQHSSGINISGSRIPNGNKLTCKCDVCDIAFCDENELQMHRVRDHSINTESYMVLQKAAAAAAMAAMDTLVSDKEQSSNFKQTVDKYNQFCVYCNKTFKTKNELEKHIKSHVSSANQKCNICDDVFSSATILAEHKLTHCKVPQSNICTVCKVSIKNSEQFYSHAQQHGLQGTDMQCIVCRQTLTSMLELQMHAKHHFQTSQVIYSCSVCLSSFNSKENLVSKLNAESQTFYVCKPCYHGEPPTNTSLTGSVDDSSPVICRVCRVVCDGETQLSSHMSEHHKKSYQCIKCQQAFNTEYEIQLHVATHMLQEGNRHECLMCNQSFDSPAKLQCHLIDHTFDAGSIPYQCYICSAVFPHPSAIQNHVLEHGVTARQYACPQCPQKFFFNGELQNHILSHGSPGSVGNKYSVSSTAHTTCLECGVECSSRNSLDLHMITHSREPTSISKIDDLASVGDVSGSVQCTACAEYFPSTIDMHRHFASHHMSEKDLPRQTFCCFECGKEHVNVRSLHAHMKLHKKDSTGQ